MPGEKPDSNPLVDDNEVCPDELRRLLQVSHVFAAIVRNVEKELILGASDVALSVSQFRLLRLMYPNGGHSVGHAADFLGVSAPAASKGIDKLVRLGLVLREPSAGDRRATMLSLSEEGKRLVERYDRSKLARLGTVVESLSMGEIEVLTGLLRRFAESTLSRTNVLEGVCHRCSGYDGGECPVGKLLGCPYEKTGGLQSSGRLK